MLTRRNLRSNFILQKSNELKKNDRCSTTFKLDERENLLMIADLTENRNIVKSLRSSDLKSLANKTVTNTAYKKYNSCKKNIYEILNKSPENENIHKRSCRKEAVKQSSLCKNKSILKENNLNVKKNKLVNSFVKKQKGNIKHVDIKFKECNKSMDKLKSYKMSINHHSEKNGNQRISKRKWSETETNIKHVSTIPIWKRQLNLNKSNNCKEINTLVDVYDIALDEELMASEVQGQKKICKPKKVKRKKELILLPKNQNRKNKHPVRDTFDPINKETNKITSNEMNKNVLAKEKKRILPSVQNKNNFHNCSLHDEMKRQNQFCSASVQINNRNEVLEHSAFNLESADSEFQSNELLIDFADDLEKSFLIPKMTSTPDTIHGVQVKKTGVLNVTNISNITATNKNCLNITIATPCDPLSNDLLKKAKGEDGIGDITLFESPTKKKKKIKAFICNSPKKLIQINLFGEVVDSLSNEHNLDDSVLIPKKAYHTPDNFKIHLPRTKRTEVCKKEIKKSKEELLIEKMTEHFDEVGDTKLCIE